MYDEDEVLLPRMSLLMSPNASPDYHRINTDTGEDDFIQCREIAIKRIEIDLKNSSQVNKRLLLCCSVI